MTAKGVSKCSDCGEVIQIRCMICSKSVCTECGNEIYVDMDEDEMFCINRNEADDNSNPTFLICNKCFESFRDVVKSAPLKMKREMLKEVMDVLKVYVVAKKV